MTMNFYLVFGHNWCGCPTAECIAAHSPQEAVDILIEQRARSETEVYDGFLEDADAQELTDDRQWLGFRDCQDNPAQEVTVWKLGMPAVPNFARLNDNRKIPLDVEGILKRQRVIDPDFIASGRAVGQEAEG